jgi:hypothetical protein
MLQQLIAITVIAFFLLRLIIQRRREKIAVGEFYFWLVFWIISALAVANIHFIDKLVADLGFSGTGIEVLLYLSVAVLFYFIFRLRLRIEHIERNITELVRADALKKIEKNKLD